MKFQQILHVVLLVLGFSHLQAIPEKWPEHYHFGTIDLKIMCPLKAEKVSWKSPKQKDISHNKTLLLTRVNYKSAGNYLCLDDHDKSQSSSVYVLIQEQDPLNISCKANSYSSPVLNCSIRDVFIHPVLVRVKAYRWNDLENSTWVQTLHKTDPVHSTINFTIPISSAFCPHEEHANPFYVSVEMMTEDKQYFRGDKPISMAKVVVPSAPENISVQGDRITWSYPSSWPRSSFYPLLFEVNATRRDTTNVIEMLEETTYSKQDICVFKVRCRDLYSLSSPWSDWSPTFNPLHLQGPS